MDWQLFWGAAGVVIATLVPLGGLAIKALKKFQLIEMAIVNMDKKFLLIEMAIVNMDKKIEGEIKNMDKKIEGEIKNMDKKIEDKLDVINKKIDAIEFNISQIKQSVGDIDRRLHYLEGAHDERGRWESRERAK